MSGGSRLDDFGMLLVRRRRPPDPLERKTCDLPAVLALMATTCGPLDSIQVKELPEAVEGCEECLKSGDPWVHLRICLECGKVGCCDSSPNRHASRHAGEA